MSEYYEVQVTALGDNGTIRINLPINENITGIRAVVTKDVMEQMKQSKAYKRLEKSFTRNEDVLSPESYRNATCESLFCPSISDKELYDMKAMSICSIEFIPTELKKGDCIISGFIYEDINNESKEEINS